MSLLDYSGGLVFISCNYFIWRTMSRFALIHRSFIDVSYVSDDVFHLNTT